MQWPDQWEAAFPRPSWGPGPLGACRGCCGLIIREQRRPNSPRLLRPGKGALPPDILRAPRRPGGVGTEKPGKSHGSTEKWPFPLPSSSSAPGAQLEGIFSDSEVGLWLCIPPNSPQPEPLPPPGWGLRWGMGGAGVNPSHLRSLAPGPLPWALSLLLRLPRYSVG